MLNGLVALCVWSLVAAAGDESRVRTQRATHYYEISGRTAQELRAAMNRSGPFGADGKRYDAFTSWYIGWNYSYKHGDGGCRLTRFSVWLDVATMFPRWTDQPNAPPKLAERWNKHIAALRLHEAGHEDIAHRTADLVNELRNRIPPRSTCDQLEAAIKTMGEALLDEGRREQAKYDKDTDHGRSQGARFP